MGSDDITDEYVEYKDGISIHAPRVGSDSCDTSGGIVSALDDFNPRSPCGERPAAQKKMLETYEISIHAPRVGSDELETAIGEAEDISIHAPRVGSDHIHRHGHAAPKGFQSTLPVWGATKAILTSLRAMVIFQSTLPVWGATQHAAPIGIVEDISIHAPRVGSDRMAFSAFAFMQDFNPRSPCGERQ